MADANGLAVLFDLDGVLVDSYEAWLALVRAAAREIGHGGEVTREEFASGWGQGIQADVARWFPDRSVDEVERYYEERFADHLEHLRVDPEAAAVLRELRGRGVPTALVTNTPGPLARAILGAGGLELDAVVGGTDVENAKPAPDIVLRAAALLGVSPDRAWVVGDTAFDRDAARAAGARFAGYGIEGDVTLARLRDVLTLVDARGGLS
jgi:phosphoglycolate phosphatase/AHBA synthesis associated protein